MQHSTVPHIAFMFIAVLFIQSFAFAQQHRPGPPMDGGMPPGNPVKELKRTLALTDEQTAKIEKIFKDQREAMEKMRDAAEDEMDAIHEKMEKSRKDTDDKITSVLTPEQKKKFLEMQKRQDRRPMRRPEPDNGPDHEI